MVIPKYFIYRVYTTKETLTLEPITRETFAAKEGLVTVLPAKWEIYDDGVACSHCDSFFFKEDGADLVREFNYCPECGAHITGEELRT